MIIAFCGHSSYVPTVEYKDCVFNILEHASNNEPPIFYLGEYGQFDRFAYDCAYTFRGTHTDARLFFITPYHPSALSAERIAFLQKRFDRILYPALENAPIRVAISHRNRWIADHADIIISYVSHRYGGAYAMYKRAKSKGKVIYNLASNTDI